MAADSKMEFMVQMTCQNCEEAVKNSLTGVTGIKSVEVNLEKQQVLIESNLSSSKLKELLESTGKRAVLQGLGSVSGKPHLGAAVAMMSGPCIQGVVRMVQTDNDTCIIEGTIDGLSPGKHSLNVHQLGDISHGCESCGDVFNLPNQQNSDKVPLGSLGEIMADNNGRSEFRFENSRLKVWDVIGRSMIAKEGKQRKACGIIARSAGLFENAKRICACDGVTLWDERDVPVAGEGRQAFKNL